MKQRKDSPPGPEKTKEELKKILEEIKSQNFYDRLGVSMAASRDEIKKAYRGKSREFHPDGKPADLKDLYTEIQKLLNQANDTLSDKRKRGAYDFNTQNRDPAAEQRRRAEQEARARKAATEHAAREKAAREQQERELGPKVTAAKTLTELLDILNTAGTIYTATGSISGSIVAIGIKGAGTSAMWNTPPSATELERELESRRVPVELGIRKKAVLLIFEKWHAEEAANANANPNPNPNPDPNAAPGNQTAQEKPKTPEEEAKDYVKDFIDEFKLDGILTPEFNALNEAQQMKVVQDLMRRMVDLVKSGAQTQYSEDLKREKRFGKIRASINKETDLKNLEAKALAALLGTDEGKNLIAENLSQLVKVTKDRTIKLKDGKPEVVFVPIDDSSTETEKEAARNFNTAANAFREIPYEWGQEKKKVGTWWNPEIIKSQRGKYEDAKKKYDKARDVLLFSESQKIGREAALTNILQMNNFVQMDQLTNTHPQFEAALNRLSEDQGFMDRAKDYLKMQGKDALNIAGGKGGTNKLIFGGGMATRWFVKATAVTTGFVGLAVASGIGAAVGGVRGYFRAEQTLAEKKKEARHGKKDASKEKARMVSVTLLTNGLAKMTAQAESATDPVEKAKILSKLAIVIEHSQGQVEKGQVNFGDAKAALTNQFNFINALNKAIALKESMSSQSDAELKKRIDALLVQAGTKISGRISEVQKDFLLKQAKNGALMGAGFAGAGYTVRWLMEQANAFVAEHFYKAENPNADPRGELLFKANAKIAENARIEDARVQKDLEELLAEPEPTPSVVTPTAVPDEAATGNATADGETPAETATQETTTGAQPAAAAFVNEGVSFENGKGAIQGIKDLQKQLTDQYGNDFSKVPEGVQKFMAETDPAKLAKNLGLYNPDNAAESALIQDGSVLKFDEQGNLTFGKTGKMEILEKWEGAMRDYDQSGPDGRETPEVKLAEAAQPTTPEATPGAAAPETANAEQAAALKNLGFTGDPNDVNAVKEFFARTNADALAATSEAGADAVENTPAESAATSAAETRAPAKAPDESWRSRQATEEEISRTRQELMEKMDRARNTTEARVSGYRPPEPAPYQYPRPGARVSGYGRGHGFFGNRGQYGRMYGYDPRQGVYLHYYEDLPPGQNATVNHNPEFVNDPNFTGQEVWKAYQTSLDDRKLLFGSVQSVAWSNFDDMPAAKIMNSADFLKAAVNSPEYRLATYLRTLQDFAEIKPKGVWPFSEHAKEYMARALLRLSQRGELEGFQAAIREKLQ